MTTTGNRRGQVICIWSGPIGMLLFGVGIWPLAHFLPPLLPTASADEVAAIYSANTTGIRLGAMVIMLGAMLQAPFYGMFSVLMKQMEGENTPYAVAQIICGTITAAAFFVSAMLFAITAFRPDRAAEATQLLNDSAWIVLVAPWAPVFIQVVAVGLAILSDKNPVPILPRWSGYLNIWVGILFVPAMFAVMFKTGPFAWNGLLAFWLAVVVTAIWVNTMAVLMTQSVRRQQPLAVG